MDMRGQAESPAKASGPGRARRLFAGWSGNYPAGRAGSGFSAFSDQRHPGRVACDLHGARRHPLRRLGALPLGTGRDAPVSQ
jgi:hypothetical protein